MRCTVKGCRGRINGFTGLQELTNLQKHFTKVHRVTLSMGEALRVRVDMENGREPNLMGAMLAEGSG